MKTLKIGVILLAFLLAAMAMVPMVSATGQDVTMTPGSDFANQTMDVTKIQVPVLNTDTSQTPITLTNEMTLDQTTKSLQITPLAIVAPNQGPVKIPYGVIIRHSTDGLTTVFDSTGKQLFSASDSKAALINTPDGPVPATHIQEVPDKSVIVDTGKIIYVFSNKALILTDINEKYGNTNTAVKAAAATSMDFGTTKPYIEGAETNILPSIGRFTARWNVPKSPVKTQLYPPSGIVSLGSKITIWNGVTGMGSDGTLRLLQPVLEWYVKDNTSDPNPTTPAWTMATWYVGNASTSDKIHSTRQSLVYSGDTMQGDIQLNTLGYDAIASITDLGYDGGGSSTLFLTKTTSPHRMPSTNVQATVMLEGWDPTQLIGLNGQYLCGSTTFQSFVLKDAKGNSILSTPMNSGVNTNYWNPSTFGLNVENSWPSSIKLDTINN
jgi:hypothetical protein